MKKKTITLDPDTLAQVIRDRRSTLGLSESQVCTAAGLTTGTLKTAETTAQVRLTSFLRICQALGLRITVET
jgi:DNA-binding phage protein